MAADKKSAQTDQPLDVVAEVTAQFSAAHSPDGPPELPELEEIQLPAASLLFQAPDLSRLERMRKERKFTHDDDADSEGDSDSRDDSDDDDDESSSRRRRRRGSRGGRSGRSGRASASDDSADDDANDDDSSSRDDTDDSSDSDSSEVRVRRRRRGSREERAKSSTKKSRSSSSDSSGSERRSRSRRRDEVTSVSGSTRLEAKRQRRREGRQAGRRRQAISESEFLARREAVERKMVVREQDGLNQIAVLEDGILVEHYVARHTQTSLVGNVYLGKVHNVLPSMEAAFVDIGKGRNAVLYSGEVNWEAAGMSGKPGKIEDALSAGDHVVVQVTKDPIGHKGARLTAQVTLAGRHLVLVPSGAMAGISRKLPQSERSRLKKILKRIVPKDVGVIVRTAAEGATEEQLQGDVDRLLTKWKEITEKEKVTKSAPTLLKGEPELAVRVVRDVFTEDFSELIISGKRTWQTLHDYLSELSPELVDRLRHWTDKQDVFAAHRVDEQLAKGMDRKVWLPSGGSLVIDRTEAMTVIDINTGKFTGSGGNLEETVTKNNLEAAEEIVRQLRLRDIGGIIVIDFIDMVLEANRDLVLRRLIECLGRDRTRHQVAEVTSLGLVQMTRKRVGQGLVEAFSTQCEECEGRGFITHDHPIEKSDKNSDDGGRRRGRGNKASASKGSGKSKKGGSNSDSQSSSNSADDQSRSNNGGSNESDNGQDSSHSSSKKRSARVDIDKQKAAEAAREAVRETMQAIAAAAEKAHSSSSSSDEDTNKDGEQNAAKPAKGSGKRRAKKEAGPATPDPQENNDSKDSKSAKKSKASKSHDKTKRQEKTKGKSKDKGAVDSSSAKKREESTSSAEEDTTSASTPAPARRKRRSRRVVTTGTITPGQQVEVLPGSEPTS